MDLLATFREFSLEKEALKRYGHLKQFRKQNIRLKLQGIFTNPYRECKNYFENEEGVYGETPLQTLESILNAFGFTAGETFIDLGCGRGRGCLFVSELYGARAIGIDLVPSAIRFAQKLQASRCEFHHGDYIDYLTREGLFYWYASTLSEEKTEEIAAKFPRGARVITISAPLKGWKVLGQTPAVFPWGETGAYLNKKE